MINDPKLREAAIARSVDLSRDAARHGGIPGAVWSLGEKLLTALVRQGLLRERSSSYLPRTGSEPLAVLLGYTRAGWRQDVITPVSQSSIQR